MRVAVRDLQPGDKVDLEGDRYADPDGENVTAEFEYGVVAYVAPETVTCTRVDFDNMDSCGFPPEHELTAKRPGKWIVQTRVTTLVDWEVTADSREDAEQDWEHGIIQGDVVGVGDTEPTVVLRVSTPVEYEATGWQNLP